jgi:hypothetical protein
MTAQEVPAGSLAATAAPAGGWINRRTLLACGIGFSIVSLFLLAHYVVEHLTLGLVAAGKPQLGDDFINYWLGARFAAQGQARLAYDRDLFYGVQQSILGADAARKFYGYPPVAMLLSLPLAALPFLAALAVWSIGGAALCAGVLSRLVGWPLAVFAVLCTPAAFLNLVAGQNGYFTAAIFGGGLMLLDRRPWVAGMLLGLLCYKPHIGLLLPLALLAGGHWRAIFGAAASVILLVAVTAALYGVDTWTAFLDQMAYQRQLLETPRHDWFAGMPTVFSALRFAGSSVAAAYVGQALSAVASAVAVYLVWRRGASLELRSSVLVLGTFLASPYAWFYDMVALLFVAAWIARDRGWGRPLRWQRPLALVLLVLPLAMIAIGVIVPLQIGPAVLWLVFATLIWRHVASARGRRFTDLAPAGALEGAAAAPHS